MTGPFVLLSARRHPAASHAAVNSSLSSSRSSSPLKLPLLPHNHSLASVAPENSEMSHRQQGYSHLPAATSDSSRSTPRGQIHYTVRDNQVAAPDSDRRHHAGTQLADGEVQQIELLEQQQEQQQQIEEAAFEQMKAKVCVMHQPGSHPAASHIHVAMMFHLWLLSATWSSAALCCGS